MGQLPDAAAGLQKLTRISLGNTGLSCVPDGVALAAAEARAEGRAVEPHRCAQDKLLPCFLEFLPLDVPRGAPRAYAARACALRAAQACRRLPARRASNPAPLAAPPPCRRRQQHGVPRAEAA